MANYDIVFSREEDEYEITDENLQNVSSGEWAESLKIHWCGNLHGRVEPICNMRSLTMLKLSTCGLDDNDLSQISRLCYLELLKINDNFITGEGFKGTLFGSLMELNINWNPLTDAGVEYMCKACPNVIGLKCRGESINENKLDTICKSMPIISIDLCWADITDYAPLASLPNLLYLTLRVGIRESILPALPRLKLLETDLKITEWGRYLSLRKLIINYSCSDKISALTGLDGLVIEANLTNNDLTKFTMLPLKILSLQHNPDLDDGIFDHLKGMINLKKINLTDTGVSYEAACKFSTDNHVVVVI